MRSVESRFTDLKRRHDALEGSIHEAEAQLGSIDTRVAEAHSEIAEIYQRDKTFSKWMNVTNWAGKTMAAGVVVGLGTISANPLMGAAAMFGGLAGFCVCYVIQMKARVRHAEITAGARPLDALVDELTARRGPIADSHRFHAAELQAVDREMKEVEGRLQVMRMARQAAPGGKVELDTEQVRINGIRLPRKASV
ncbi:MAG: threonine/serine exporter family protein [Armatimonadetes bacterium]|nr:threonine/serine exporter family protein [Armatimonadota bacterium]